MSRTKNVATESKKAAPQLQKPATAKPAPAKVAAVKADKPKAVKADKPAKAAKVPKAAMVVDYAGDAQVAEVIRVNQARRKHNTNTKAHKLHKLRNRIGRLQTALAACRYSEHDILPKVYLQAVVSHLDSHNGEAVSMKSSGKRAMSTVGQHILYDIFNKYAHQLAVAERTRVTPKIARSALQIERLSKPKITAETDLVTALANAKQQYFELLQRNERREKQLAKLAEQEQARLNGVAA